ncbi:MAG: ABC transporter permease [Gammaproteobacteria bacterium]|nr:ABC transporter permease [Gammaproteobacteria bacterium]
MTTSATLTVDRSTAGQAMLVFSGDWVISAKRPEIDELLGEFGTEGAAISFNSDNLNDWDSALLIALCAIHQQAKQYQLSVNLDGLPDGARGLLHLALAVEERKGARKSARHESLITRLGNATLDIWGSCVEITAFIGELVLSFGRLIKGKANYRKSDLAVVIQEAGAEALPIVGLISFLIGMIFAFVGIFQLKAFGAGIYTADLVAVAMVREMAPIMTAIIMAGRTGAAYAAQIGTMKVNEEIDALTTLGINPIDFLALPRVIALIIMMPLLTMYSSLIGILGGLAVGMSMLDVSAMQYLVETQSALSLSTLFGGLFKAVVYGSLIGIAGCLQGLNCGNNAMAVGQATTNAVVMGIVMIVVSAAVLTVIYINIGI